MEQLVAYGTCPCPGLLVLVTAAARDTLCPAPHCVQLVVEQGVLLRASKELTMATATGIADSAMEYTVKCVLWALK